MTNMNTFFTSSNSLSYDNFQQTFCQRNVEQTNSQFDIASNLNNSPNKFAIDKFSHNESANSNSTLPCQYNDDCAFHQTLSVNYEKFSIAIQPNHQMHSDWNDSKSPFQSFSNSDNKKRCWFENYFQIN